MINDIEKIMLIDRDKDFLTQAKKTIESENEDVEVLTTTSIEKSIVELEEHNFQVIISSYDIGKEDDLELLREVRKEKLSNIPFILLIDRGCDKVMLKALKLGANRVFLKRENEVLSCQILREIVKQELLNQKMRKEIEHHRNKEFLRLRS